MFGLLFALMLSQAPQSEVMDRYIAAQKAYAANPTSEERLVALVSVLYENTHNERAIALLEPFVKANPAAWRARLFLALGYARIEKYAQARTLAAQVAATPANDYYAQHILGLAHFGLNEFTEAEASFQKAIALKSDFADAYFQLGLVQARNPASLTQAQAAFEKAIALGYVQPEIYRNLGSVTSKLGKFDEAIAHLRKALQLKPNYPDAYFQLADALRKTGASEEAAEATARFRELNAEAVETKQRQTRGQGLYEQGMSFLEKDDYSRAYQAFKSAAEILPQLDAGFYRMAQLEYLGDDRARAQKTIRHALELNPFEPEYYFVLARCLESSDTRGAIEAAEKAVSLNNTVADFHALLADLYEKSGDRARAAQSRRRATQLDPKRRPLGW
jgi:tetratricopeptide (TPR) repeat protein